MPGQTDTASVQGKVVTPLQVTVQTPPDMVIGVPYSYQLQPVASGGTPPYSAFSYVSKNMPAGITCSATGLLSGTPTGTAQSYPDMVEMTTTDSGN